MKEIAPGIWHWKAEHPKIKVKVSSYFLPEAGVLLDPLAPDDVPDRLEELGPPSEILLTNRHHYRDCQKLHERFGGAICSDEAALYISSARALAVADGVINYDGLGFVPDNLMDEPEQTKEELKAAYRGLAAELDFDNLLLAHGDPVVGGARDELRRFAES